MAVADSPAARAYHGAALPAGGTPWREVPFVVIDLETTGLDSSRHEIISFATLRVSAGRVLPGDARYELVRPNRMPDEDTIRIHGLRDTDLSDAPPLSELLGGLLEDLTGTAIVAHVAAIERGFLGAALAAHGLELRNPFVDTAALDRELRSLRRKPYASREPIGLSDMARRLGLPVHRPHHADGDALTTAQAFIALATHLERFNNPLTLGRLQGVSEPGGAYSTPGAFRRLIRRLGL